MYWWQLYLPLELFTMDRYACWKKNISFKERFSPTTQRFKNAPFTTELYMEIEKSMAESSNWVHDRAAGLGADIPNPEVLKKYLDDCETFVKINRPK